MLALPDEFAPVGLVRTEASKQALLQLQSEGATAPIPESSIEVVDVTIDYRFRSFTSAIILFIINLPII